jgi:HECT-domain (ubiquitin-transferase)
MLNAFTEGLGNVIPVEILPLFTGEELRIAFCGSPKFDVDLLKQVVEYEGYDSSCKVVEFFWETIESMTAHEHKQFLQFVWARNRLPVRASEFESPFKIQKDSINVGEKSDRALPSASTCFFSLTLPEYSTVSILKEKLLFAINNVTTMETDFQTNGAEIAEGYRAF